MARSATSARGRRRRSASTRCSRSGRTGPTSACRHQKHKSRRRREMSRKSGEPARLPGPKPKVERGKMAANGVGMVKLGYDGFTKLLGYFGEHRKAKKLKQQIDVAWRELLKGDA